MLCGGPCNEYISSQVKQTLLSREITLQPFDVKQIHTLFTLHMGRHTHDTVTI